VAQELKEVFIQAMVGRYDQGRSRRLYQDSNSVMATQQEIHENAKQNRNPKLVAVI
jgi:hypothetical protein